MAGNKRFDYIGFANNGEETGSATAPRNKADAGITGGIEYGLRGAAIPFYAASDMANAATKGISRAGNWLLKKTTGYEVPYEVDLPTNQSMNNLRQMGQITEGALAGAGLRKVSQGQAGGGTAGAVPTAQKNLAGQRGMAEMLGSKSIPTAADLPRRTQPGLPDPSGFSASQALPTQGMGTFQVEGGKKRSFSADASGAWYEGGKPMGGIYGAAGPGAGGMGRGNAEVNAIVQRLLAQQPQAQDGIDRRGLPMGQTMDEYVNQGVQQRGWDAGAAAQMYYRSALPASTGNFSAQQNADYQRGVLGNQTAKTQLDALMTPSELAQRAAMADMYGAHAQQYRTMSDPNFLLKMKGKDAETEQMKARNELMKTLLPKAYETAIEFTKKALENNPNADANALFNSYMNNAMKAYTDEYSQGKRYSDGMAIPGEKHWVGFNSPEVNVPGGWQSQDQQEFYQDFAAEMAGAKQITDPNKRALRIQELMNLYSKGSGQFRG